MTWDEETEEYARDRICALAQAVTRATNNYVNHPSRMQAEAAYELLEELWDALEGAEGNRQEEAKEKSN